MTTSSPRENRSIMPPDPFAEPSVYLPSKPDLLAVHGEQARGAWSAWNAAMHDWCLHEMACNEGCRNDIDCCEEGARLAKVEQQAYIYWDTLATRAGVPSGAADAVYVEPDDLLGDAMRGLWIGASISLLTGGGIGLVWFVFHFLLRGGR